MADGYARVTGRVGVCEGPSGGGATYILPGVVEANESSIPVLGITSDISVASRGRFALTELDQAALYRPLTKWNTVLDRGRPDIPRTLRRAFREMTTGRPGAAHIGLPYDVQKQPVDDAELWAQPGSAITRRDARVADRAGGRRGRAAARRRRERPLFICGGGVVIAGAEPRACRLADAAGRAGCDDGQRQGHASPRTIRSPWASSAPTAATLPTRAVVDAGGPRRASSAAARARSRPSAGAIPAPGKVTVIHLDVDPRVIGANYPDRGRARRRRQARAGGLARGAARGSAARWGRDGRGIAAKAEQARRVRARSRARTSGRSGPNASSPR